MIHHKPKPILYVDDTVEQRYAMRRILETEGFKVLEAGTGKEAMQLLAREPALAVVDVKLPDISGYDLTRSMKARQPHLPVLQVSASFSDPGLRAAGLSGGADGYIAQPVYPAELVAVLQRMLRASEADGTLRFLASIGPKLSSSLSMTETAEHARAAMVPYFADHCTIYVATPADQSGSFWSENTSEELLVQLKAQARADAAVIVNRHLIVAPIAMGAAGSGAIAFALEKDREYSAGDALLASDLASRAGMALQNCVLFASVEATREALIRAEKLATAGRMAAAIAHEINNPLEALTNLIYILEQSPNTSRENHEIASAALVEITRLAHITRQTLGFYRELRTATRMNLSQSITDTVSLYKARFEGKQVRIETDLADDIPILAIPGELRQVISNLLVNALEATDPGGHVRIETALRGDKAWVSICDTGGGIPAEILSKVFEPFFTTKQGTGTGLGLWITQSIVEKHHGVIHVSTVQSGTTQGTCFEIEFPLSREELDA